MAYLNPTAGAAREGGVSTGALDAGVLAASATGRALMASNYFDATTVAAKFGTDSLTNAVVLQLVQDGALAASSAGRALMADGFFDATAVAAKFGTDSFTNAVILQLIQDGAFAAAASSRALFADRFMPFAKITLRDVEAHTAGDTLLAAESGSVHTNTGASGTITIVLPAATVGQEFFFYVGAAFELRIDPNTTETISLPSTGVPGAAGKYLVADLAGESVYLACAIAGSWSVLGFTGTWSAEG